MNGLPSRTAVCCLLLLACGVFGGVFGGVPRAAAQSHWSPKLAAGGSAWFIGAESDGAGFGPVARAQLLRSGEGLLAWGAEVAYNSAGTFEGGSCLDPACTTSSAPDSYVVRLLDVGPVFRLGRRGGRDGVYGTLGLSWTRLWEDWDRAVDRDYGGLGASLGVGYALPRTSPAVFFELRTQAFIVGDQESAGGAIFAALTAGLSF